MTGVRARVRAETTSAIKDHARVQLASVGADGLSLRAIARDLDMVSSAIYRYFPSKADLLTALIVDAYDALGAAAESAESTVPRDDLLGRWNATSLAAYRWAKEFPADYALIFGTPVPGYAAPTDTIAPAARFTNLLLSILSDVAQRGLRPAISTAALAPESLAELARLRELFGRTIDDDLVVAGFVAWTSLFGAISFALFGQWNNVVQDQDALVEGLCITLGRAVLDLPTTT